MKIFILTIAVLSGCAIKALAYTDSELVMAIYYAEGGRAAQYPFGIRSVYCGTWNDCKRICEKTIKNNHIRFAKIKHKGPGEFIEYLGRRYCPSKGRSLTQAERRLNQYWVKNVKFYLRKGI